MNKYYLKVFCVFSFILFALITYHYFGPSPYGGPLESAPFVFFPFALLNHFLHLFVLTAIFAVIDALKGNKLNIVKLVFTFVLCVYIILEILNLQAFRWLGYNMSLGYFKTFFGSGGGKYASPEGFHFAIRFISGDLIPIVTALMALVFVPVLGLIFWLRRKRSQVIDYKLILKITLPLFALSLFCAFLYPPIIADRVRPLYVNFLDEIWTDWTSRKYPKVPEQAFADLISYTKTKNLAEAKLNAVPEYPMLQVGPGNIEKDAFLALPKEKKPNIIFLEMESLRGWESALAGTGGNSGHTPELDAFLKENAAVFPWTHSGGFPSAVGTLCLSLGLPPHPSRYIATERTDLNAASLPEILRDFGYKTEIMVGTDPAISNFTHWFNRWYEKVILDDGKNTDRILFDEMTRYVDDLNNLGQPFFLSLYTFSLHVPYDIPAAEGIKPADSMEERFKQTIRYSTQRTVEFLERLKKTPIWDNTIIVLCGDHSYPTPEHVKNQKYYSPVNPGFTWTTLAFTGGSDRLPSPGLYHQTANQIDIAPTVMKMLDIKAAHSFMGHDIFGIRGGPSLSVANRHIMLQFDDVRYFFDLDSSHVYKALSPQDNLSEYGMFDYRKDRMTEVDDIQADRWRDMVLAYAWLVDKNKIFPYKPQYLK